jgi:alanine racemase
VVVKADGYGHGAVECARAALEGGASDLAVATADEAIKLRAGAIDAPLLVLGALTLRELAIVIAADAAVVIWCEEFIAAMRALGRGRVHVKLDTGMGRAGTRDPGTATRIARMVHDAPELQLVGAMTHFATADDRSDSFFGEQLTRFRDWSHRLSREYPQVVAHAANSAATLRDRAAHFGMVRCGVAAYGLDPFGESAAAHDLEPALELQSYLAAVKPCLAGESAGYGRRFIARSDTTLGILPIGYADGYRRAHTNNAEVLLNGNRYPLVGSVSMDSITVDLGSVTDAKVGQTAVLIGRDGKEQITAEDLARRLDTINYEITCGLTSRVPRVYHYDGDQ